MGGSVGRKSGEICWCVRDAACECAHGWQGGLWSNRRSGRQSVGGAVNRAVGGAVGSPWLSSGRRDDAARGAARGVAVYSYRIFSTLRSHEFTAQF